MEEMGVNKNRNTKNAFFSTIQSISTFIFPLITFPYISRTLLAENIGKINFSSSIIVYISLLSALGISTYAIRECSKVRGDKEKLNKIASEIFSINVITTIVAYIVLFALLLFVPKLTDYRLLIIILSLTIPFATAGTAWMINVMEDFKYIAVRHIGFQICSIIAMFIFVHNPDDYIKYAIITVASNSGANLLNIIHRRKYCNIRFTFDINWKKHLPPVLLLFSMLMAQEIFLSSDNVIIGFVKSDTDVGIYSVSVKFYNIIQSIVHAVQVVLIPQLAAAFSVKDFKSVNKHLRYAVNFELVIGLPCMVGVCLVAEGIVLIVSGESFLGCVTSLRILMLALFASTCGGILNNLIMIPSGRDKLCMVSAISSAVVNLVLNLVLIPHWGINAAAFTTFLAMVVGFAIKWPFVDKQISFKYLKKDIISPFCGCIIMSIVCVAIGMLNFNIYIKTTMQIIVSILVYFGTLTIMKNEFLGDILKSLFGKFIKTEG